MKKFDWFNILCAIAIIENTICFIIQGGWLSVLGVVFAGIWLWVAYWDWKRYQTIKSDHEEAVLSFLGSDVMQYEDDINNSSPSGIDFEAIAAAYGSLADRDEVSVDEFAHTLNAACKEPHFIGDVSCKNNARSPFLRCAVNPDGPCHKCKDHEEV
ncbi:DUF6464 family protein [Nostoc sp.]